MAYSPPARPPLFVPDLTVARLVVTDTLTGEGAGAPSGENLGGGVELHVGTSDAGVLQYRTLGAGAGVSLATTGNLVTVAATGGGASAENIGGGDVEWYAGPSSGGALQFRTLDGGAGIALATVGNKVTASVETIIGAGATGGSSSVVVGDYASAGDNSVVLGVAATAGSSSVAVGTGATAANAAQAMGTGARAEDTNSLAVGSLAHASGVESSAFGLQSQASGLRALALGSDSLASGQDAAALGGGASASGANSLAVGAGAVSRVPGTTVLSGPQCLRRTDGGAAPGFQAGSGSTALLSTGVVAMTVTGTYSVEVPSGATFYPTALSVLNIFGDASSDPGAFTAGFDAGGGAAFFLAAGVADGLSRRYAVLQGFRGTNLPTITITSTAGFASACRFVWEGVLVEQEAA